MGARSFYPKDWRILIALTVAIGAVPFILDNDYFLLLFNIMALNAIIVLGLNLLIGSAGQVSFGHAAFYGLGAYASAIADVTWGLPLPAACAFALLVVGAAAFLLALPTLRLEGHYLVMATLGFNIIISIVLNQMEELTGGPSGLPGISRLKLGPFVLNTDREFYFFIWTLFLVLTAVTLNLTDSRLGRALHAIHEKELTARVLGVPSYRYKVTTFVLSAVYAGLAGFCYAHYVTFISPKTFDIFYSVQVVTMVVIGGLGSLWGGLAGTVLLTSLPSLLHHFEDMHVLIYGLILMGVLVYCPNGLMPFIASSRPVQRVLHRKKAGSPSNDNAMSFHEEFVASRPMLPPKEIDLAGCLEAVQPLQDGEPLLTLEGISLSFGGLQALHDVSLRLLPGEITALIGPNGAGKTTLLNVISGLLKPDSGEIRLKGCPITRLAPHCVAARGVGRTFQAVQVYQKFTVLENVLLGRHVHGRSGFASAFLHSPGERIEEIALRGQALSLLEEFQLAHKASLPARQLSLLEQKVLELARAVAVSPCVLLLDEPVGGLSPRESEMLVHFISLLRGRGIGMILVEHDMNVVMGLADKVVVLQHGIKIAEGSPREIQRNERVITAYLGAKK
jgi:branched-chain amino acid transport system permease protein